jgi:hypothetical protein
MIMASGKKRKLPDPVRFDPFEFETYGEFEIAVDPLVEMVAREMRQRLSREVQKLPRPVLIHFLLCKFHPSASPASRLRRVLLQEKVLYLLPRTPHGRCDLPELIEIGRRVLQGSTQWAAAGEIAEENATSNASARHALRKRIYDLYLRHAAVYQRLAQAPDTEADVDEIIKEVLTLDLLPEVFADIKAGALC